MAKIKCSICSYQFNIWYAGHRPAHILIWFLAFGQGSEACFTLTTGCLGMALQPSAAHYLTKKIELSLAKVLYKSYMYHLTTIFPDTPGTSALYFNFSLISRSQLTQTQTFCSKIDLGWGTSNVVFSCSGVFWRYKRRALGVIVPCTALESIVPQKWVHFWFQSFFFVSSGFS